MSFYDMQHSRWYDLIYAQRPYRAEAAFVCRHLTSEPGRKIRLLELACGTGTHALIFEQLGCEVSALDYSADMLKIAEEKAKAAGSAVKFSRQDMCAIDYPGESFDGVVSLFDSIGYVVTNERVTQTLAGAHRVLKAGGMLILEFWHAAAMLSNHDPLRVRTFVDGDRELLRVSATHLTPAESTGTVDYQLYELRGDGTYSRAEEQHTNRYFSVPEMDGLLRSAGFQPVKWRAGFTESEEITAETWHVVVVATKAPDSGVA